MKHKFKPSVSGNRGRNAAAAGGGRSEKQSSVAVTVNQQHKPTDIGEDGTTSSEEVQNVTLNADSREVDGTESGVMGGETSTRITVAEEERGDEGEIRENRTESNDGLIGVREQKQQLEQVQPSGQTTRPAPERTKRRRVAPTVVSSRPWRSKPSSSNRDKSDPERDKLVSSTTSTSLTSSSDLATDTNDSDPRNNLVEQTNGEEVISNAPEATSQIEETHESHTSTGVCNLSGVLRSSLDLVCPPPTRDEGATFELSREERRLNREQSTTREEDDDESRTAPSESTSIEGEISGETISDQTNDTTSGSGRITRSRKRQLQLEKVSGLETVSRRRKTRANGRSSRSPPKLREAPDRSSMTMQELIYYNPSANPMSSSVEEKKRKSQQQQQIVEDSTMEPNESSLSPSRVLTPAPPGSDVSSEVSSNTWGDSQDSERLVPQLRIGKDGNIVLDEESVVVAATARPLAFDDPLNPPLIEGCGHTTSASYRKTSRVTRWTGEETTVFFRALSQVGTDFTMMTLLLPKRSRKELKNKFKKEEKSDPLRVSQALKKQISIRPRKVVTERTQSRPKDVEENPS